MTTDAQGVVVGVAFVHLVSRQADIGRIATRKDLRGQGIAQAMLMDAFEVARQHGCVRSILNTDSRTGALGLYQKVGMSVFRTWVNRCISL